MVNHDKKKMKVALIRRINRHVDAQVALSWKGSAEPSDRAVIKDEADNAKSELKNYINSIFDRLK